MPYKVDFHTHSTASPDGALRIKHFRRMLEEKRLDCIAVTDHNTIKAAQRLQRELGERHIIVGEEISTTDGEIIGLYLREAVPPHLSGAETVKRIHAQHGLVYIPHPFETVRKGMGAAVLSALAPHIDIIEVHNGRAVFQNYTSQALIWAMAHAIPGAAASDAHGIAGWGKTYTLLSDMPTRKNLVELLRESDYMRAFPSIRAVTYPKFNRLRKWKRRD